MAADTGHRSIHNSIVGYAMPLLPGNLRSSIVRFFAGHLNPENSSTSYGPIIVNHKPSTKDIYASLHWTSFERP